MISRIGKYTAHFCNRSSKELYYSRYASSFKELRSKRFYCTQRGSSYEHQVVYNVFLPRCPSRSRWGRSWRRWRQRGWSAWRTRLSIDKTSRATGNGDFRALKHEDKEYQPSCLDWRSKESSIYKGLYMWVSMRNWAVSLIFWLWKTL